MPEVTQIDHRYRVLKELGEGLTGDVYLVEAPEGRFALKLLKPFAEKELEENLIRAFKFEFGFLKDLRHPHVVGIHDFGFDEILRRFYFTEEFLDGRPIHEFCKGVPPETIIDLFLQSIDGLQAIHRAGILHGDIKGNNLLVVRGPFGPEVKIIDLGLSDPRFPFSGGTPSTMAPEKILHDPADERSDLYSLGVVFYQLFTGENPFVREDIRKTYEAHLSLKPPKVTLKNPRLPLFWNEIFETLLAKNPAHRYRNCEELLEAIHLADPRRKKDSEKKPHLWRLTRWVGRTKIIEKVSTRLREALGKISSGRRMVFLVSGERGVGKSRIAQDIKYIFQMENVDVFESRPGGKNLLPVEKEKFDLWILNDWSRFDPAEREQLIRCIQEGKGPAVVLITLLPEEAVTLKEGLAGKNVTVDTMEIPPFSREDLSSFLEEITHRREIPDPFLNGLWEKTHGNPRLVISLLEHLAERNRLVDSRGHWNLSLFKEGVFDWAPLPLDLTGIDRILAALPPEDHFTRAELWIKRSEELLKKNRLEEAARTLAQAETETHGVGDLSVRLHFRARIYEKEGWKLIREGRLEEARSRMERALALLEESSVSDAVLSIRLNNFLAWIFCQQGKIEEAVAIFESQQSRWEKLKPEERARILNNDLGYAYLLKGDVTRAVATLERSLKFYEEVGDVPSRMKGLYNLAEAHVQGKNYARAIEFYLKAAETARLHRNFDLLLRAYNGLGKTYHLQGAYGEGLSYYERSLELARYLEDYLSAAAIAQNIGSIQSEREELDASEHHFRLALKMLSQLSEMNAHAKYLKCRALLEMGDVFRKRKNFEEAERTVHDAHQLALQEESLASFLFWILFTQAQIEKDRGRWDRLQDLSADLLHYADDAEKRERCQEILKNRPGTQTPLAAPTETQTRVEKISSPSAPVGPARPAGGELAALIRVARWLASEKDPERLLTLILRQATELSGAEAGMIMLDDGSGNMDAKASVNLSLDDPLLKMSGGVARQVLETGEAVVTGDALTDTRFKVYESVVHLQLHSILALPIRSQNGVLGVLSLVHRHRVHAFDPASLDLLKAFADQAGLALENARLVKSLEEAKTRLAQDLETAQEELEQARRNLSESSLFRHFAEQSLISGNKSMADLFRIVERLSRTDLSVLIRGESGTGKELIARYLHRNSNRAKSSFVAVNCAALPANLVESELFGYRAGAFTGATRDKKGLLEEAQGGTLFLDEIAELELPLQAKLLRALEEREITRLGDTRPIPVNFRLLSATHRPLQELTASGKFREDLFYRICEIEIPIPPLRERKEDIPLLAQEFIDRYLKEQGEKVKAHLGRELLKLLLDYPWPGNVRELENVIRVATALRRGSVIRAEDLPEGLKNQLGRSSLKTPSAAEIPPPAPLPSSGGLSLFDPRKNWREIETLIFAKALLLFGFDVKKAAASLQCAASTLYQRVREHGLEDRKEEFTAHPFSYREGTSLDALKKETFQEALRHCEDSPYQAAKALGVSPGMVYKWI
jgi:transcriptional regulator with GAF, ATPase, and Fis domain/serine/threonine protein kinase/Tfp pilus assembly protein PilF